MSLRRRALMGESKVPRDGLVAEWTFDVLSASSVVDTSGNGNDLTLSSYIIRDGVVGCAIQCTSTSSNGRAAGTKKFDVPKHPRSVSCWCYVANTAKKGGYIYNYFSANGGYIYRLSYIPNFGGIVLDDGAASDTLISKAVSAGWHHVVSISDENRNGKLYVDGILVGTYTAGTAIRPNNASYNGLNIGLVYSVTEPGWATGNTITDQIRIYNRALTPAEVSNLYNNGLGV